MSIDTPMYLVRTIYVTRFYKTDPNRISGKINLTPPVDSYTIVLVVLTPVPLKLLEAGFNRYLFWGVYVELK